MVKKFQTRHMFWNVSGNFIKPVFKKRKQKDAVEITEIAKITKLEGFLVTMDIQKAFDLLNHNFLIFVLEKHGFGKHFILWVKILKRGKESYIINGGRTRKYFSQSHQGDPISPFLFI